MPYLTREIGIQDCTQFTVAGDTRPLGWFRDQYWAAMKTLADTQNQLKAAQSQVSQLQNQLKQQGSAIQLQQEVAQLQNQLQATQNNLNFQVRELKGQTDLWRQGLEHVLRDYADPLAPTTPNLDPVLQIRQLLDGKNKRLAGQPVHSVQTSVAATDERQSPAAPPAFAPAMDPSASTGTPSGPSQVEDLTLANASPSTAATGPTVPGSDAFDGPIFVGDEGLAAPPAGTQGGVAASHVPGMPSLAEDGQNSTGSLATAGSAQGDAAGVGLVDRPKPLGPEGGTSVPSGIAAGELIDGEEIGPTAPLEAPPAVVPQAVTALDDVPPRTVNDVVPLTPAVRVLDQQADPSSSSKRRRARRSVQPPSNNLPPDSEPPDAFDPSV